jgi:hypothetical protein
LKMFGSTYSIDVSFPLQRVAMRLSVMRHSLMRAYSVDLKKTIDAVQHGSPKAEVARTYGAGLPTVERYMKVAEEEGSLNPKTASGRLSVALLLSVAASPC